MCIVGDDGFDGRIMKMILAGGHHECYYSIIAWMKNTLTDKDERVSFRRILECIKMVLLYQWDKI